MAIQSDHREVGIRSPLGGDKLLFGGLTGGDRLGALSEYHVALRSEAGDLSAESLLGKTLSVRIHMVSGEMRWFNGYVVRFAHTGWQDKLATYEATLRHWPWLMTRKANCRIFQDRSVVDILEAVFTDYTPADYELHLSGEYLPLPYCVQYRETDFAFVSRLMEEFGIYYFMRQSEERQTLILADSIGAHEPIPGYHALRYLGNPGAALRGREIVSRWHASDALQPEVWSLADFDFERATNPSAGKIQVRAALPGPYAETEREVFDYPGRYTEYGAGQAHASVRMEAAGAQRARVTGWSNARGLFPGGLFTLADHPRAAQNGDYLIVRADYVARYAAYEPSHAGSGLTFDCTFEAIEDAVTFRSPCSTPRPVIPGPQTAMVTGRAGEEIWTDKYGRIKVQFHWDREGHYDEASSCWVRVAQTLAGKRWGAEFIPRVGQEVLVDFLEGDPDRPLVTGTVYNVGMMPPYELPNYASRSTIKTNSTKGGGGFNELRFEDKKGSEQVFVHGERDLDMYVKNDARAWVGGASHTHVKGNRLAKVDGERSDAVAGNHKGHIGGQFSLDVGRDTQHKSGTNIALGAGMNIDLKGGVNITLEAGMTLTLKAGASTIVLGPAGVAINGVTVTIDGSALVSINGGGGGGAAAASDASPAAPADPDEADDGSQ